MIDPARAARADRFRSRAADRSRATEPRLRAMAPSRSGPAAAQRRTVARALAALVAALSIAALACDRASPPSSASAAAASSTPRSVRTAVVEASAAPGARVAATVLARQRATLTSRLAATVEELPFDEGRSVRAGDLLVRLDDLALRSALAAADAAASSARSDRERMERLLERDAATPRETEAARARDAAAEAEVAAARDALRYAGLRAPFAGRIARRLVRQGDVVSPGQSLVEIEGEGGYELRASVDAAAAAAIVLGAALPVEIDGVSGSTVATVRAITPAGDPGTHRFELVADLGSVEGLRSGLYARLVLPAAAAGATSELTIPAGAAFARGGLNGVFVVDHDVARLRWIAAGQREGDRLGVRAGLAAGERIVLDPAGLADGDAIAVQR